MTTRKQLSRARRLRGRQLPRPLLGAPLAFAVRAGLARREQGLASMKDTWKRLHAEAMLWPRDAEVAVVKILAGLHAYADYYKIRYGAECTLATDHVLGPAFEQVALGLLVLLNGETGRLDCGTIDAEVRALLRACGFSGEG